MLYIELRRMKKNRRFFKLIMMQKSYFADTYDIHSPYDINPGQCFFAKGKRFDWCQYIDDNGFSHPKVCVWNEQPQIHFCDNAIDLLMWYIVGLGEANWFNEVYFYEIIPMLPYCKQRCNDKNNLFQCGAPGIKIVRQLTIGDVFRIANKEIKKNIKEIINRYPNQNMMKLILCVQDNVIEHR